MTQPHRHREQTGADGQRAKVKRSSRRFEGDARPGERVCEWPGCEDSGCYRAPKSRQSLREYAWFCLEHVREYNRRWDYFAGMDADDIDGHRREDVTWHRPTWSFGARGGPASGAEGTRTGPNGPFRWRDPYEVFEEALDDGAGGGPGFASSGQRRRPPRGPDGRAGEMAEVMQLGWGFTERELKERYKVLVKRHHPDLHGGDRVQEEKLKRINEAYAYLMDNRLYA